MPSGWAAFMKIFLPPSSIDPDAITVTFAGAAGLPKSDWTSTLPVTQYVTGAVWPASGSTPGFQTKLEAPVPMCLAPVKPQKSDGFRSGMGTGDTPAAALPTRLCVIVPVAVTIAGGATVVVPPPLISPFAWMPPHAPILLVLIADASSTSPSTASAGNEKLETTTFTSALAPLADTPL